LDGGEIEQYGLKIRELGARNSASWRLREKSRAILKSDERDRNRISLDLFTETVTIQFAPVCEERNFLGAADLLAIFLLQ
jgi:hypothetical protein